MSACNSQFKNIHKGETCFIFGNGGSLKFYDLSLLPNALSFCCSFSLIDKRMQKLRPKYNVFTDSYLFYPLLFNTYPFVRKFQINEFRNILRDTIRKNPNTHHFCNVTNYYALKQLQNVSYFHHYGDRFSESFDLASKFSTCGSALEIMIGAARYTGVEKFVLFGCDYLYDKALLGHFYSDYKPYAGDALPDYINRFRDISRNLNVTVVRPKHLDCGSFESVTFEDHFGLESKYNHNYEIIDRNILNKMRLGHKKFQLQMEPF
jgi:hypothetical protein